MLKLLFAQIAMMISINVMAQTKLCMYQLYSTQNGYVMQTFGHPECYTAKSYCDDASLKYDLARPVQDDYRSTCKTPDEAIYSGKASYVLYCNGLMKNTFNAVFYSHGIVSSYASSKADSIAYDKCSTDKSKRINANNSLSCDCYKN